MCYILLHSLHISKNCFLSNGTRNMHILASGQSFALEIQGYLFQIQDGSAVGRAYLSLSYPWSYPL